MSHLRFGPRPVRAPWLVRSASFVAVHDPKFLETTDVFAVAAPGATFLLNTPVPAAEVFAGMPREAQDAVLAKRLKVYAIDGAAVAEAAGLGRRISSVMQTCFFALSGVLPREDAIARIRKAAEKTYGRRGAAVVRANFAAIDAALAHLHPVAVPAAPTTERRRRDPVAPDAPDFVRRVTAVLLAGQGDALPVSAFPVDGTWPTGTARFEKRAIGLELPVWDEDLCIQCGKCAFVCPHAAIRAAAYPTSALAGAPAGFRSVEARGGDLAGLAFTIQVAPDDCTGCGLCVAVCPAKDRSNPRHKAIDMAPAEAHRDVERPAFDFFLGLPHLDPAKLSVDVKGSQLREPLFEFSGACAGCGETPYLKLLSQLFGDRMLDRQRHGLLVDLRRQPPDHAVARRRRGAGAGVGQLALRGQRGVRPRVPAGGRCARDAGGPVAARPRPSDRRRPRGGAPRRGGTRRRGLARDATRARRRPAVRGSRRWRDARPGSSWPPPTRW